MPKTSVETFDVKLRRCCKTLDDYQTERLKLAYKLEGLRCHIYLERGFLHTGGAASRPISVSDHTIWSRNHLSQAEVCPNSGFDIVEHDCQAAEQNHLLGLYDLILPRE